MRLSIGNLRSNRGLVEAVGLLLVVFAGVLLLSLLSYSHVDATWFKQQPQDLPVHNWIGRVGATLAEACLQLFGVTAFVVPLALGTLGGRTLLPGRPPLGRARVVGCVVLFLALGALTELLYGQVAFGGDRFLAGGYVGLRVGGLLRGLLNTVGAVVVTATAIAVLLILIPGFSLLRSLELSRTGVGQAARALTRGASRAWAAVTERLGGIRARAASVQAPAVGRVVEADPAPASGPRPPIAVDSAAAVPPVVGTHPPRPRVPAESAPKQTPLPIDRGSRGYSLPPTDLLQEPEAQRREDEKELLQRARHITDKFREFSIEGSVVAIHPGPVVTTFEFKPDAGVKYSKITGMTDDLSLALRAESVRIDRLPGRATVGIEVPNRHQETIFPRELIDADRFRASKSKLRLALGKDIHGDVYVAELDRMPHLLIAGATGAGKSVGLNGMIVSMLYTATPEDLRFIMIDTKMIELGIYADIPHLLIPVVTEPKQASTALKWAVREMEQRYRKLAAVGVRNIAQFNALIAEEPDRTMENPRGGDPIPLKHLAYIVIVIDEMADLMMVSSADVEESVMRLAQMARAVGIHLILATQRPSVDVITGTIKANFPSRIAFRVSQRVDSRTIIDQQGAEHLLGRGDMLFLPTGSPRVVRLHSGFITEREINRITSFLKKMAEPVYDPTVLKEPEESRGIGDNGERDEMFVEAVRTVIHEGKCSITLIQRRLQLGYARAARIVDMMEREGVVSVGEGSKPRDVLVGPEILETFEARQ